jgi:hypothetical protein
MSTTVAPVRKDSSYWGMLLLVRASMATGAGIVALAMVVVSGVGRPNAEGRAWCDRAVATLLKSRDPMELQRADILIRRLDCAVRRRLPMPQTDG